MSDSKTKTKRVEPRLLKGLQDYLPASALPRRRVIAVAEEAFLRFGFAPVYTPAMEHLDVLLGTGGENTNKELFRLESPEGEPLALRFDHTVPYARVLAQYPDRLKAPFRRFTVGPVWRADKPGPGRFREFVQLDADVAGAPPIAADADIIAVMAAIMQALEVADYRIQINHRGLVDALLAHCGIDDTARQKHVLRVVDKLDKVGLEKVRQELGPGRIDESGDPIPGVKLDEDTIGKLVAFVETGVTSRRGVVDALRAQLPASKDAETALAQMTELAEALDALEVSEAHAVFAPSLARGLDYYTGPVFEMLLPGAPEFGSVMGGGRYDALVTRFAPQGIPCTGMSVGLDRLTAALQHLGALPEAATPVQVLLVTMPGVPQTETLRVATALRAAGLNTEPFFASKKKMQVSHQLSHADRFAIPVAVILGEDELAQGLVAVKDLQAGKAARADIDDREAYRAAGTSGQETVPREALVPHVQRLLGLA